MILELKFSHKLLFMKQFSDNFSKAIIIFAYTFSKLTEVEIGLLLLDIFVLLSVKIAEE